MSKKLRRSGDGRRATPPRGGRKRQRRHARVVATATRAGSGAPRPLPSEHAIMVAEQVALAQPDQLRGEVPTGDTIALPAGDAARDATRPDAADAPPFSSARALPAPTEDASEVEATPHVERGPATDWSLGPGSRGIRRTRTLADVVQPGRSTPHGLSALDPADAQQAPPMRSARGGPLSDTMPTLPRIRAPRDPFAPAAQPAPMRPPRRAAPDTRPIAADDFTRAPLAPLFPRDDAARQTRRLTHSSATPQASAPTTEPGDMHETDSRQAQPQRLGSPRLVTRVALGHACVALVVALSASVLLVRGDPLGFWLLGLVLLALPGALLAYVLLRRDRRVVRLGGMLLVATQLGALGWAFVVLGPRAELVLLVPACIWQAQRLGGRPVAALAAVGATVLTLAFTWGAFLGLYRPVVVLDVFASTAVSAAGSTLGLGLVLWAVLSTAEGREKSELVARVRLYELRQLRAELTGARASIEREAEVVGNALFAALHGKGIDPITVDGPLGPVAEGANAVADRLSTLQKDREDRIRQEGALRIVIRAVERGWLGLSWTWPDPSGTVVDDLVALLRTPRPRERRPAAWNDDMPTLVPLPSAANSSGYWRSPFMPSNPSAPSGPGASAPDMAQARFGWDDLLGH